jgi:hypothetical protein
MGKGQQRQPHGPCLMCSVPCAGRYLCTCAHVGSFVLSLPVHAVASDADDNDDSYFQCFAHKVNVVKEVLIRVVFIQAAYSFVCLLFLFRRN